MLNQPLGVVRPLSEAPRLTELLSLRRRLQEGRATRVDEEGLDGHLNRPKEP